ncbi:oligosaccharyl transferase [Rostrohypoxylon terebratum]|nr:oligosaccharyl transferase [Rostrohypoxylon terebratum]
MAPKKSAAAAANVAAPATPERTSATTASTSVAKTSTTDLNGFWQNSINYYLENTPQRTKLIDVFMAFLVVVGGLQFAYCVLAGNYPFNAFLSGFSATVGQFVLTASLRIQTNEGNKSEFPEVSPERAFADYVVGSLILHFFCINFIN